MKKSFYKLIYVSFVFLFLICAGGMIKNEIVSAASWTSQVETPSQTDKDGYTVIHSEKQLAYLINNISASGKYRLGRNLDMSGYTWPGIQKTFSGTFDGAGFIISNITSDTTYANQGLFSSTSNAKLLNIWLTECKFTGSSSVGSVVGYATGKTEIRNAVLNNCKVEVNYKTAGNWPNVGGAVGMAMDSTIISRVFNNKQEGGYVKSLVSSSESYDIYMGGIVGQAKENVTIEYCFNEVPVSNTGTIKSGNGLYTGGIAGWAYCNISNCGNHGEISAGHSSSTNSFAGGIAGNCQSNITNCYNRGNITANAQEVAGTDSQMNTISQKYNDGSNTGMSTSGIVYRKTLTKPAYAGGISGKIEGTVSNSYNVGSIGGGYVKYNYTTTISCFLTRAINNRYDKKYTDKHSINATITTQYLESDIAGNKYSHTNCYGIANRLKKDANISVSSNYETKKVPTNSILEQNSNSKSFSSVDYGTHTYNGPKYGINAYTEKKTYKGANYTTTVYDNLEIKTVYSSTAISMTFNFNYKTWRSSTPVSYSILSDTFSRTEFTSIKTVDEIKTLTISNAWKTQSGCNSGFPFIKEMYW